MAIFDGTRPKWGGSFLIDDGSSDGYIRLAQKSRKAFALESTIQYVGETGLEDLELSTEVMKKLRRLEPCDLEDTDLASVPQPLRWWVNTYGVHTPAALIHDRFIGGELPDGVTEAHIDRYFRFMLKDTGVRYIKRWIMWSAVALRTRILSGGWKTISVVLWSILAVLGIVGIIASLLLGQWWLAAVLAFPSPVLFAVLWGRQWGAGVIAAYAAVPWVVPPLIITAVFLVLYATLETIVTRFLDPENAGSEPVLWHDDPDRGDRLKEQAKHVEDQISSGVTAV